MAYESPIRLVTEIENRIIEDEREGVYKAVLAYKIDISKDELFRLLYGARKQYEKGFSDGYAKGMADAEPRRCEDCKHGHWINDNGLYKCSVCNEFTITGWANCIPIEQMNKTMKYCNNCGTRMDGGEND